MPPASDTKRIMVVAGELSGDMHAARLIRAMRAAGASLSFFGIGGDHMAAEGVEVFRHVRDMEAIGFSEVIRRYPHFRGVFNDMTRAAEARQPDIALFIDYPGFNLRLARRLHNKGIRTVFYICPQVWAWNRGRIPRMARFLDRLITIFPFESACFEGTGLPVTFVGHPLVEEAERALAETPADLPWRGEPRVALLPGSRRAEVERILPALWGAARLIERDFPSASFIIAAPNETTAAIVRATLARLSGAPASAEVVVGKTRHVLRQARAAWVASGTATIEAALMRCPMLVVYRTSWLTYAIGRLLIRIPHIGMVNIVAGRTLCPEFIQASATEANLAAGLAPLLRETPERAAMLEGLDAVRAALGTGGDAERAAAVISEELARARLR